jgi:hypothetical protein
MAQDSYDSSLNYKELDLIAWQKAHEDDLWTFDKLIVSRLLGHVCGPHGSDVPKPGYYIVRPCVNFMGMGAGSRIQYIEKNTDHILNPGEFWCEIFEGRHLSVDFVNGEQDITVEGFKLSQDDTKRFSLWKKVNDLVPYPEILKKLRGKYLAINIEMIDGKIIEIHLRNNPDFMGHKSPYIKPIWKGMPFKLLKNETIIEARDGNRLGFIIRDPSSMKSKLLHFVSQLLGKWD